MPLQTAQYSVGTAAVEIMSPKTNPTQVLLHNAEKSGNNYIFFGGSSAVTTSTGIHIDPSDNYQIILQPGNSLWAIASATRDLHVMWQVL
jgi:hypothetical protein